MLHLWKYIVILVTLATLSACSTVADINDISDPSLKTANAFQPSTSIIEANTQFGADMLKRLSGDSRENVFISPLSLSTAIGMLYAGAEGGTAKAIEQALYLPPDNVHAQIGDILTKSTRMTEPTNLGTEFEDDPQILSVQNSLWIDNQLTIKSDFKSVLQNHYQAKPFSVDFKNMPNVSRVKINDWVESKTENRIQDLLSDGSITPYTKTVLVNTVYMKSHWHHFIEGETKPYPFLINGEQWEDRPMMEVSGTSKTDKFRFAKIGQTQSINLPYSNGMSMIVILPPKGKGLEKLNREINADRINAHIEAIGKAELDRRVNLRLPKFKLKAKYDLEPALKAQGMGIIFDDAQANFNGISDEPLAVDSAFQQVFLDVNEKGTEAAAATALVIVAVSRERDNRAPVKFHVDRPFLMLIRDNETGAIVFMGRIIHPSYEGI